MAMSVSTGYNFSATVCGMSLDEKRFTWVRQTRSGPAALQWEDVLKLTGERVAEALREEQPRVLPKPIESVHVPAIALTLSEDAAAEVLGISVSSFRRNVRPHVREVQIGRLVRYPVAELERFVNDRTRMALD